MDSLIYLSTPAPSRTVFASLHPDFTPGFSKALAENFKRRRQSLLPNNKRRENDRGNEWIQTVDSNKPIVMDSISEFTADDQPLPSTIETPKSTDAPFDWTNLLQITPNYSPMVDLSKEHMSPSKTNHDLRKLVALKNIELDQSKTPQPQKQKQLRKREPTTPVTPTLLQLNTRRRKVLIEKSTNKSPDTTLYSSTVRAKETTNPWLIDYSIFNDAQEYDDPVYELEDDDED
jgi:hypothetical protein